MVRITHANWPPTEFKLLYPSILNWNQDEYTLFNDIINYGNSIKPFEKGKVELEQYTLPTQLIAFILVCVKDDLNCLNVIELGSGTGRFSLPIAKFFSQYLLCIDIDSDNIFKLQKIIKSQNLKAGLLITPIEFLETNIKTNYFDTVIMNPPFGTKRRGIDMVFLKKALNLSPCIISIHKSNFQTRKLITKISKSYEKKCEIITTVEFYIPPTFHFHRKRRHGVCVDVFRFHDL